MAIELAAINCDKCGVGITHLAGPNWVTWESAPRPNGWVVVSMFCPNPQCKAPMGTYAVPEKA
jgi:hypothetical protein